ncbi:acyl-CoA dehydrogenase family protein [Actinomadura sp. WMMA1423]|uniref:acyl-CoA dehydrogenase family protein n=1 Tax=Actinomadura sp. WMMA1423 TaxID=2591108 RepID=UPI001146949A|nr:acyl-CoA dehydrogenase family protein [Actinomadura sp. WMMA1423]
MTATAERLADEFDRLVMLVGDQTEEWDRAGSIPRNLLRDLGSRGMLCPQVDARYGGIGAGSLDTGEATARIGSLCSSLRSVMTSQGMAAWTIGRLADSGQRQALLSDLVQGRLAAIGFSEAGAGSDLSAMTTTIRREDGELVVDGAKVWVTAACYADFLVIVGHHEDGAGAVVVPTTAPGVRVRRVGDPLGCRAAGHADVTLDSVRLPLDALLGGTSYSLPMLVTTALAYGRMSVAWGCVGILRACLRATTRHAAKRRQFGRPLAEHQLVARHLAELFVAEQAATRICEHASRCWDAGSADLVVATILAKHTGASQAVKGAASAVQVLASAGAHDGHVVARAYRDAKLMEIIEGSSEICQLILAEHAVATG